MIDKNTFGPSGVEEIDVGGQMSEGKNPGPSGVEEIDVGGQMSEVRREKPRPFGFKTKVFFLSPH